MPWHARAANMYFCHAALGLHFLKIQVSLEDANYFCSREMDGH